MKTLYLLRHAKSSWQDPALDDFERPLNPRGNQAAPLMGAHMARKGYVPDVVLCSPSRRTVETLVHLKPHIGEMVPVRMVDDLYLASAATILSIVQDIDDGYRSALVIGHNPGMEECLAVLVRPGPSLAVPSMPTAALGVLTFETDTWMNVLEETGRLAAFATPKSLSGIEQD